MGWTIEKEKSCSSGSLFLFSKTLVLAFSVGLAVANLLGSKFQQNFFDRGYRGVSMRSGSLKGWELSGYGDIRDWEVRWWKVKLEQLKERSRIIQEREDRAISTAFFFGTRGQTEGEGLVIVATALHPLSLPCSLLKVIHPKRGSWDILFLYFFALFFIFLF